MPIPSKGDMLRMLARETEDRVEPQSVYAHLTAHQVASELFVARCGEKDVPPDKAAYEAAMCFACALEYIEMQALFDALFSKHRPGGE